MIIPADKKWIQTNEGELSGSVFSSRNMDFDKRGYASLAKRATALALVATPQMNRVTSIDTLDGITYYLMTNDGTNAPYSLTMAGNLASIAAANAVGGVKFDGVTWQGLWWISQDTRLANYDGATWQTGITAAATTQLTSGNFHPLCVFENLNKLCVGDGNIVKMYTAVSPFANANVSDYRIITLPTNYQVRWIRWSNNNIYIGTLNTKGGEAMVFVADGSSTSASGGYKVPGSSWAYSGVIWRGVLVVMSSQGQLLRFNGAGFDELAHLPVYDTTFDWANGNGTPTSGDGKVSQRGMCVEGDNILINLDGALDAGTGDYTFQLPNQPSGLWVYDPNVGLYHKAGASNCVSYSRTFSSVDTATDIITASSSFTALTGTKVFLSATTVTGLAASQFYYLIRVSSTTFKLATSYDNATAGTAINLTAGSTGTIYFHDDDNFGEAYNAGYVPGAVLVISSIETTGSALRGYTSSQVLFGAGEIYSNVNTAQSTVQTLTEGFNVGHFVTPKIHAQSIKEAWQKVAVKYDNVFQGCDNVSINFKTKNKENFPIVATGIIWIDGVSFSTTTDVSAVSVDDEIEIVGGRGSGYSAHIIAKQSGDSATIITIDETIPNVTAGDISSAVYFHNWSKIHTTSTADLDSVVEKAILKKNNNNVAKWVQFKIELRGVSKPYIEELQVTSQPHKLSV